MEEPSAGVFHGREHRLAVRVYYEDTDFTGVVYHANYLRFLERGRSDFLRAAGVSHAALLERPDPLAFVVTRIAVDFVKAARIDDALTVRTTYDTIAGPRLRIGQTITRTITRTTGETITAAATGGEAVIVRAQVEAACITLAGRARRAPAELVERLRAYLL